MGNFFENLWNSLKKAVEALIDYVIRPIIKWVIEAIEFVKAELRYWKHEAMKLLAEWLDNDFFFLLVVVATVVLAIYWPKILAFIQGLSITAWLKGLWEAIKKKLASILDFIHIIDLQLINSILKSVWPEWRELMGQLSDVASALAEELGQGSGYIHSYFSVVHSMALLGQSALGLDPKLAELQAFEETSAYLEKIDERFNRYAHDPGLFTRDIIEEIYLPYAENFYASTQETLNAIRGNYERISTLSDRVEGFADALAAFIEDTPEELKGIIEERFGEASRWLSSAVETFQSEVLQRMRGVVDALEAREAQVKDIQARLDEMTASPVTVLQGFDTASMLERKALSAKLGEIIAEGAEGPAAIQGAVCAGAAAVFSSLAASGIRVGEAAGRGWAEGGSGVLQAPKGEEVGKSWYVGEY